MTSQLSFQNSISTDVIRVILSYCDRPSFAAIQRISHLWHEISQSETFFIGILPVTHDISLLRFASRETKESQSVLEVLHQRFPFPRTEGAPLLLFHHPSFERDRTAVLIAVTLSPEGTEFNRIPPTLCGDREITLAALEAGHSTGYAHSTTILSRASPALQDDEELVRIAVRDSLGDAFQHASARLQGSLEFVKTLHLDLQGRAFGSLPYASQSVREQLAIDREWILKCIQNSRIGYGENHPYFAFAHESLRNDPHFVLKVIRIYPSLFSGLSPELQHHREVALVAAQRDGSGGPGTPVFSLLPPEFREDTRFVCQAVRGSWSLFRILSPEQRSNPWIRVAYCIAVPKQMAWEIGGFFSSWEAFTKMISDTVRFAQRNILPKIRTRGTNQDSA